MPEAAVSEEQAKAEARAEPKRLSKYGEWRRKHPNGEGLIIHDMKAVLREYDTPWWETPKKEGK
ncbi:MAG: hypothetical protein LBB36_04295 [Fibromonadaceae bacterium]|jgi:hypothetical protein|nr:hypothetical protein [Fibromonadaceae bacterium]